MKTVAPAPTAARTLEERTQAIVAMVRTQGFQTIEALSVRFQVTPQTIRRDVNLLCESGLLRRRHDGVDSPLAGNNLSYRERQVLNIEAKRAIARRVAEDVPQRASVFFGIGTTPEQCAQALAGHAALKAMTNNLNVAMILRANPDCEITIAGGRIRNADGDVIAGEAHGFFARAEWLAFRRRFVSCPVSIETGQAVAQRPSTAQVSTAAYGKSASRAARSGALPPVFPSRVISRRRTIRCRGVSVSSRLGHLGSQ